MESISRNIILDLLPAYIAGEASIESRELVEKFAQSDPEITNLISAGEVELSALLPRTKLPEDLEMKTMNRIRSSIRRQMWYVAFVTTGILLVPLIAMLFTNEVNWDVADFVIMGCLLFGTGLAFVLIARRVNNAAYRAGVGIAVVAGLLLVWVSLAVGILGSADNPANLLYISVLATGIIGAAIGRCQPRNMSYTLFAMALVQVLIPGIAWIFWRPSLTEAPGTAGIFLINAFFAAMFCVSALLFRRAAQKQGEL